MSASAGQRRNLWPEQPDYRVDFVPTEKRVRAEVAGTSVVDTTKARLLLETGHTPVYYLPRTDVRMDLLQASAHTTFCPFKGVACYWHLRHGQRRVENATWSYQDPFPEKREIKDWLAFYWNALDHWYEEDDEVFVHPRDPHVRIDVRTSSRPVGIIAGGRCVAESRRARFLYETGLPTRFYLPADDVRTDLLEPSGTRTGCPYKGFARYWSLRLGERYWPDLVWSYADPLDEARGIREMLCFFEERVDRIELDGVPRPTPHTKWSA